ncbi:hypothetical protein HanPSC8_Chr06g0237381 [Helianthus annuus]|nr:hypothetical protein HanPSC8_Chr06g0237381 [Helianthus annuus]
MIQDACFLEKNEEYKTRKIGKTTIICYIQLHRNQLTIYVPRKKKVSMKAMQNLVKMNSFGCRSQRLDKFDHLRM